MEVSKRVFSRLVRKKEFIIFDMICRICIKFVYEGCNFSGLRIVLIFVLGFYGFFRVNEFLDI